MDQDRRNQGLLKLVVQSRAFLVRQAFRILHNGFTAEDAAQDAVLSALTHLEEFRGDSKLKTWLYRVGANAALMNIRKEQRFDKRKELVRKMSAQDMDDALSGRMEDIPSQGVESAEKSRQLYLAISKLPKSYQTVVIHCDLAEQSIQDVAHSLGMSVGGVRTRRLRAHRMLKDVILHQLPLEKIDK